jgi:hypothetical protein
MIVDHIISITNGVGKRDTMTALQRSLDRWFVDNEPYPMKKRIMLNMSPKDVMDVLSWWKVRLDAQMIRAISHIHLLECVKGYAYAKSDVKILDAYYNLCFKWIPIPDLQIDVINAITHHDAQINEWWYVNATKFNLNKILDSMPSYMIYETCVLDWWFNHSIYRNPLYDVLPIVPVIWCSQYNPLFPMCASGLKFDLDIRAIVIHAISCNNIPVLKWFFEKRHVLDIRIGRVFECFDCNCSTTTWLFDHRYDFDLNFSYGAATWTHIQYDTLDMLYKHSQKLSQGNHQPMGNNSHWKMHAYFVCDVKNYFFWLTHAIFITIGYVGLFRQELMYMMCIVCLIVSIFCHAILSRIFSPFDEIPYELTIGLKSNIDLYSLTGNHSALKWLWDNKELVGFEYDSRTITLAHPNCHKFWNSIVKRPYVFKPCHSSEICSICLDTLGSGIELSCKHQYHKECIDDWFLINSILKCPMCRRLTAYDYEKFDQ